MNRTYNPDAEESVVGSIMLTHMAARHCQEVGLKTTDFGNIILGRIYGVAMDNFSDGKTTDRVILVDELQRRGMLDEVGGKEFIARILDTTPNPGNIKHYVNIVLRFALARRQYDLACRVRDCIRVGTDPSEEIMKLYATTGGRDG